MRWPPVVAVLLALAACSPAPLLSDVTVQPAAITPDQDGSADVTLIAYRIGAPAVIDLVLVDENGVEHVLRQSRTRAPGPHEALFGGVVGERMLPDGDYTVRLTARPLAEDGVGQVVEERPLTIRGGDTTPPELAALAVAPQAFTPNQDGLGDRVTISYRLDEPAEVRLWVESAAGEHVSDILEEAESGREPGEPGPHVYDYDAGVDADAPPPPDGEYVIVAEARDAAGNVTRQRLPLTIRDGGQPRAAIVGDVDWSDTVVPLGGTLSFTATVVNVGNTPIRTRGPEPGFVFDNTETFNLQAPEGRLLWVRGRDRTAATWVSAAEMGDETVEIDLASADRDAGVSGARPLGAEPEPGAASPPAADRLCGRVVDGAAPVAGARVVAFESDGDNGVETVTDADGGFCFTDLPAAPPEQRTFARSPGAIRLGLEYDERRTDVEYPFRWQLGRADQLDACVSDDAVYLCLPPGATVEVTGGVRFVEPPFRRVTNAYLALMHEDVRRMQGPYNPRAVTIEF